MEKDCDCNDCLSAVEGDIMPCDHRCPTCHEELTIPFRAKLEEDVNRLTLELAQMWKALGTYGRHTEACERAASSCICQFNKVYAGWTGYLRGMEEAEGGRGRDG